MRKNRDYDIKNRVPRILLAHLLLIVALVVLVCFVTDRINPDMEFISSTISKWVIGGLSIIAIIDAIFTITALWKRPEDR